MADIEMRTFARQAGVNITFPAGNMVFRQGDPGDCMYIVQSGVTMIDTAPRSSTARVKEAVELSILDQRKFRFIVDEVPNFALYIMGAMARRIRGMSQAM
jgi:CRP-like cAMP-binding protein